jgi:hypothetical protein
MSGHFFNLHIDIPTHTGQSIFSGIGDTISDHPVLIRPCVFMQRLKTSRLYNWFLALRSYNDLRPDLGLRRQINRQVLATRPAHCGQDWYQKFWASQGISREVATFLYQALAKYSGLQLAKVLPNDRLCEDLKLPLICWFDWELALCEDFHQEFGFDLEDYFDLSQLKTVADLMGFFNQQVAAQV